MEERGLTAIVEFDVAHFRVHITMKGRTTYLLPLPTTIIGFFYSILGKSREEFIEERENFLAGAKILDFKGISRENAQLLKLKPNKESKTAEEIMILLKPKYKFALWGERKIIEKIYERMLSYDFHFVPYGGISDFIFWDVKDPEIHNKYLLEREVESSYAPLEILSSPELDAHGILYSLPYLSYGEIKKVVMSYKIPLNLSREVPTLEGVPMYKPPLEVVIK
ncbi:CRISPR-associated protein (Cas_Cas5) [Aciduliprofundum sp. MAR08-339]|uniref:CRISPR-associated protein Cas5 n=1 Tax=Aciduliprofundum sp. (strain MAR08-339) TaxID=673860 RepID=UPI0002A4C941|nr:CRISPR-associated protein (Cas_Cas5) [Aciduliprofundum sp. MAR08-339]